MGRPKTQPNPPEPSPYERSPTRNLRTMRRRSGMSPALQRPATAEGLAVRRADVDAMRGAACRLPRLPRPAAAVTRPAGRPPFPPC